jgi:hypothetical protein
MRLGALWMTTFNCDLEYTGTLQSPKSCRRTNSCQSRCSSIPRKRGSSSLDRRTVQSSFGACTVRRPMPDAAAVEVSVDCLFLRSPSRVLYRTELIPRAPKWRRTRTPHPQSLSQNPELPRSHPSPVRGLLVTSVVRQLLQQSSIDVLLGSNLF